MYKVLKRNDEFLAIIRLADNACIPFCDENTDYKAYLEWVSEGNVAEIEEI